MHVVGLKGGPVWGFCDVGVEEYPLHLNILATVTPWRGHFNLPDWRPSSEGDKGSHPWGDSVLVGPIELG